MTDAGMSLGGKRVVVLGGSSGIGFAVAELAQQLGAEVVVASSDVTRVQAATQRLTGATGQVVDLRDEGGVAAFFGGLGPFDHLVSTVGDWTGAMRGGTRELDLSQARQLLEVRFWGVLMAVKYASRTIAQDGSVTLTSGVRAHRPARGAPLATALGGAVEHLTLGLAVDLAPIRVNAVSPGLVLTEAVQQTPPERLHAMVSPLPLPRAATPVEAAQAYVYLMLNSYTTGQILPVDGGGLLI